MKKLCYYYGLFLFLFLVLRSSDAFISRHLQAFPSAMRGGNRPAAKRQRAVIIDANKGDSSKDDMKSSALKIPDNRRGFIQSTFRWSSALVTAFGLTAKTTTRTVSASTLPTTSGIRYYTANDIPDSLIESHQYLYGYVEKVIDGDTVRIRHVPDVTTFLLQQTSLASNNDKKSPRMTLGNTTITVRMYGIDAPETAKKQSEVSQPFGEDAKQLTKDLTFHKLVTVKLLRRDKYNRIVGEVETVCSTNTPTGAQASSASSLVLSSSCATGTTDVSVELVSKGLATLYTGGGAEYNGNRDLLKQSLEAAQRSELGIWSLGDELVTPKEYKRQKRLAEQQP